MQDRRLLFLASPLEFVLHNSTTCFSEHATYINKFCDDFKSTLERMIANGITERKNTELTDALHLECVQHVQFAQERCKLFRGRKKLLEEIQDKATKSRYVSVLEPNDHIRRQLMSLYCT